jgi:hypothetical protein
MRFMMIWLAALAAAATPPHDAPTRTPVAATVEARVIVRILSGVRIDLSGPSNGDAPPPHEAQITVQGKPQPAQLIEFE